MDASLRRIEQELKDILVDEFEEIFLEAMRNARPGYEEVQRGLLATITFWVVLILKPRDQPAAC